MHPGHARERDSNGGREDRAAEQCEPADDVSQHHHYHCGQQGHWHGSHQHQREQRQGGHDPGRPVRRPFRVPTGHHAHLSRPGAGQEPRPTPATRYVVSPIANASRGQNHPQPPRCAARAGHPCASGDDVIAPAARQRRRYCPLHDVAGCGPSCTCRGTSNPRADRSRVYAAQPARECARRRAEQAPRRRAKGSASSPGRSPRAGHVTWLDPAPAADRCQPALARSVTVNA